MSSPHSLPLVAIAVAATVAAFMLVQTFRKQLLLLRLQQGARQNEAVNQSRLINQEVTFYEERKSVLDKHASQRRLLSEAARGLGALLDPTAIQEQLIHIARLLFPFQPVAISYGQTP